MTYDKEFEEWFNGEHVKGDYNEAFKRDIFNAWQAARKDHYRIGEDVESYGSDGWELSVITATREGIGFTENPEFVRKIPAKSSIDEIAEEAASKWFNNPKAFSSDSLSDAIKSAILKYREGREAGRTDPWCEP